jgi:phospholipid/cholesterol/gamma-HCH transport system permease protein
MISNIGRVTLGYLEWLKGIVLLFLGILYWFIFGIFRGKFVGRKYIFQQMVFVGLRSVLLVFFVDFFTGMVLAMQTAYQLEKMGAVIYVASLVAISLCRELSPVLTGLVVAGRAGSAIAAELGTMKVTEQI